MAVIEQAHTGCVQPSLAASKTRANMRDTPKDKVGSGFDPRLKTTSTPVPLRGRLRAGVTRGVGGCVCARARVLVCI